VQRGIQPTRVFPLNRDIDRVNNLELAKCGGPSESYLAADDGEEPHLGTLQKNCPAPDKLVLKRGAQVMLLKNLDAAHGLVNGARGVVVDFTRNLEAAAPPRVPVVQFEGTGGLEGVAVPIQLAEWTVELGGRLVASRSQVPLKLAYALSLHKSQGLASTAVDVSLGGVVEDSQAYTALSRDVWLDRLGVHGFSPAAVRAHPRVIEFYSRLERAGAAGARAIAAGPAAPPPPPPPPPMRPTMTAATAAAAAPAAKRARTSYHEDDGPGAVAAVAAPVTDRRAHDTSAADAELEAALFTEEASPLL